MDPARHRLSGFQARFAGRAGGTDHYLHSGLSRHGTGMNRDTIWVPDGEA